MIARTRIGLIIAAAAALACNETPTTGRAGINGTHDLTVVGDLLFITATDANELRVVDLAPVTPRFVRAPNPLHPLSIPVVERPVQLVRDTLWAEGQETGGNWVYALSANARQISVVGAADTEGSLVERAIISAGPTEQITSLAARGNGPDAASTLYVGTYDTAKREASIRTLEVPPPGSLSQAWTTLCAESPGRACVDLTSASILPPALDEMGMPVGAVGCATVSALLVLPKATELAYALRPTSAYRTECAGARASYLDRGTTYLFDTANPTAQTLLQFGSPVRQLFTHSAYAGLPNEAARIFGVLDESSCLGAGAPCRGVLAVVGTAGLKPPAVDPLQYVVRPTSPQALCGREVGDHACDVTGWPMLPLSASSSLIMGAATGLSGPAVPPHAVALGSSQLVGVASNADGTLQFWDAEHLREFDVASEVSASGEVLGPRGTSFETPFMVTPQRGLELVGGPQDLQLADGSLRDEQVFITHRGYVAGARAWLAEAVGSSITVPQSASFLEANDELVIEAAEGCPTELHGDVFPITAVTANMDGTSTLTVATPLPSASCVVNVRPGEQSTRRWVVTGTVTGLLGRFAADGTRVELPVDPADRARLYAYHRPFYEAGDPANFDPNRPAMSFDFVEPFGQEKFPADLSTPESRIGVAYVLNVNDQFEPFRVGVAAEGASVAGRVMFRPQTSILEVAFPSGDLVVQIDARAVAAGQTIGRFDPFR